MYCLFIFAMSLFTKGFAWNVNFLFFSPQPCVSPCGPPGNTQSHSSEPVVCAATAGWTALLFRWMRPCLARRIRQTQIDHVRAWRILRKIRGLVKYHQRYWTCAFVCDVCHSWWAMQNLVVSCFINFPCFYLWLYFSKLSSNRFENSHVVWACVINRLLVCFFLLVYTYEDVFDRYIKVCKWAEFFSCIFQRWMLGFAFLLLTFDQFICRVAATSIWSKVYLHSFFF